MTLSSVELYNKLLNYSEFLLIKFTDFVKNMSKI